MADGFEFPCCVEYAKSDRSSCVKCKSQILKQELRIGQQYDRDHSSYRWYHLECFQYAKNFPKTAKTAEDFLFGYERISSIDQKRVSRTIEKAIYNRDNAGHGGYEEEDDALEVKPKQKQFSFAPKKKQSYKGQKEEEYKEKEKERETEKDSFSFQQSVSFGFSPTNVSEQPLSYNYGEPATSSYSVFVESSSPFIGFDSKHSFDDKENTFSNNTFPSGSTSLSSHQVFASSPLKKASSRTDDLSSFLHRFAHRLSRQQLDWLEHPTAQADKVRRAIEAAQTLYNLDNDEDDLIDTLERVYLTLGVRQGK